MEKLQVQKLEKFQVVDAPFKCSTKFSNLTVNVTTRNKVWVLRKLTDLFKSMGVKVVYDTSSSRDVSIIEACNESSSGTEAGANLPMFSSACPGLGMGAASIHHVVQKLGIKPYNVYHVTVMPCYDKKLEAVRDDFIFSVDSKVVTEVDSGLTTGEVLELIQSKSIDFKTLEGCSLDRILTNVDEEGHLYGVSGGYAETVFRHAARALYKKEIEGLLDFKILRNSDFREIILEKGELYSLDVISVYKYKNTHFDVKVDMESNISTTLIVLEFLPCTKLVTSVKLLDYNSGKVELQYFHENASFATAVGMKPSPVVEQVQIVGDDLLVTNLTGISKAIKEKLCNALLLKVNQIQSSRGVVVIFFCLIWFLEYNKVLFQCFDHDISMLPCLTWVPRGLVSIAKGAELLHQICTIFTKEVEKYFLGFLAQYPTNLHWLLHFQLNIRVTTRTFQLLYFVQQVIEYCCDSEITDGFSFQRHDYYVRGDMMSKICCNGEVLQQQHGGEWQPWPPPMQVHITEVTAQVLSHTMAIFHHESWLFYELGSQLGMETIMVNSTSAGYSTIGVSVRNGDSSECWMCCYVC